MNMKKKKWMLARSLFLFMIIFSAISNLNASAWQSEKDKGPAPGKPTVKGVTSQKISRGKVFGSNSVCVETFEYFPEETLNTKDGTVYKKTIIATKEFKKNKKDNDSKIEAEYKVKITFTYDKQTFVKIEDVDKDIVNEKKNGKWEIVDLIELFPTENTCLVSTKCLLYESPNMNNKVYLDNSHIDIFCSVRGKLGIHSELH